MDIGIIRALHKDKTFLCHDSFTLNGGYIHSTTLHTTAVIQCRLNRIADQHVTELYFGSRIYDLFRHLFVQICKFYMCTKKFEQSKSILIFIPAQHLSLFQICSVFHFFFQFPIWDFFWKILIVFIIIFRSKWNKSVCLTSFISICYETCAVFLLVFATFFYA